MNRTYLILLTAVLVVAGGVAGYLAGPFLARAHPRVRLAARIALENRQNLETRTLRSEAFRTSGGSPEALYAEARDIENLITIGGAILGAWCGLVVGLKLVFAAGEREGDTYEIMPAMCVACGRCYESCPHDRHHDAAAGAELQQSQGET